ncbi:hypothetical protein L195_g048680 [Trifolium pratense]|nr:hypothetical protein L195_g048680 [Trifolium pratense]
MELAITSARRGCQAKHHAKSSQPHSKAKPELKQEEYEDAQMHEAEPQQHLMSDIFLEGP